MSSIYRILCLSHDPAIATDADHDSPEAAEAAIWDGIDGHRDCDLLIGRWSGGLVELGCPPSTGPARPSQSRCFAHSVTVWVDVAWLRLLAAVHQHGGEQARALTGDYAMRHWPWERLRRLRDELGIDLPDQQTGDADG